MLLHLQFDLLSTVSFLVPNGDFETSDLSGFTASGINGGSAVVEQEGTCFSFNNTAGITFNGDFAANVRSSGPAPTDSVGILTSDPFLGGSGLTFRALSENDTGIPSPDPVTFEVRLLDVADNILLSQVVKTSIVTLNHVFPACSGAPVDGPFSTHTIDTAPFEGVSVKVQFLQHTKIPGSGFFTLVDDISIVREVIEADIDIKPGSDPNSINLRSNGVISAAILTTSVAAGDTLNFDATSVDTSTVEFGDAREDFARVHAVRTSVEDVDGDGDLDLVVHFATREIRESRALDEDSIDAILAAETLDGTLVLGMDSVRIVPNKNKSC